MRQLKDRIEKLKAEIQQTRIEKDNYLRRANCSLDDGSVPMPLPMARSLSPLSDDRRLPPAYDVGPLPLPYDDRPLPPSTMRESDDWFRCEADDNLPPQWVEQSPSAVRDLPRDDVPRDYRAADSFRGAAEVPADKQPTVRDLPRDDVPRDRSAADNLRAEAEVPVTKQPTSPEPRSR